MRWTRIVNQFRAKLHRPEQGWDPVPKEYARRYANEEYGKVDLKLLELLNEWVGGFAGKRVLDLGGGPAQYSIAFAKMGAQVTWHDVSLNYQRIAQERALANNVAITFSLGYLDEAGDRLPEPFDLVFNRICWYYCFNDKSFADTVFKLVRSGGVGYIDTNHSAARRDLLSAGDRIKARLNEHLSIKIGHPLPPRGRLASLFASMPVAKMVTDYSTSTNDRILFKKAEVGPTV